MLINGTTRAIVRIPGCKDGSLCRRRCGVRRDVHRVEVVAREALVDVSRRTTRGNV